MTSFDPFGRLARHIPEKRLHRLIRLCAVVLYAFFFARRLRAYHQFALKALWAAETLVYLALAVAFLVRVEPVDRSRGIREVLVPLIGGLLPFALLLSPPSPRITGDRLLLRALLWWMAATTSLTAWGMWTLRRSFSITVEARALVTRGPYRFVRHPIYLGEILSAGAIAALRLSAVNCAVFALFVLIQLVRARREEEKLARNFPAYRAYADNAWWFW